MAEPTPYADCAPTAEDWAEAVRRVRSWYPEDVFPAHSRSKDARAGTWARRVCDSIALNAREICAARIDGGRAAHE